LIYGRVFARPILENNGGILLDDHLSVSSILSHEVIETVIDPHINLWANKGNGVAYALEACDPVESDVYSIQVPHLGQVTVSNFVTPRWFSPQAINDKFDWMGKTGNAFEVTKGGYVVYSDHGTVHAQAGADHPKWRKDTKRADTARSARRFPAP
jgi:hypothetical protein